MGIKGEQGDGFPQLKPALIMTFDCDAGSSLGPTTHPENHLHYMKFRGTVESVRDGHPPFTAEVVDAGTWLQQEALPSGESWIKSDSYALLRVIDPPNTSADPAVAEVETGLIRFKATGVSIAAPILKPALNKDTPELLRLVPAGQRAESVTTYTFQTGDPRYKYLEHAVYAAIGGALVLPAEDEPEGRKVVYQSKVGYLAA